MYLLRMILFEHKEPPQIQPANSRPGVGTDRQEGGGKHVPRHMRTRKPRKQRGNWEDRRVGGLMDTELGGRRKEKAVRNQ